MVLSAVQKGHILISEVMVLNCETHVPNLLSISKLTKDLNCVTIFCTFRCEFGKSNIGNTIGSAKENEGLYYFEDEVHSCGKAQTSSFLFLLQMKLIL